MESNYVRLQAPEPPTLASCGNDYSVYASSYTMYTRLLTAYNQAVGASNQTVNVSVSHGVAAPAVVPREQSFDRPGELDVPPPRYDGTVNVHAFLAGSVTPTSSQYDRGIQSPVPPLRGGTPFPRSSGDESPFHPSDNVSDHLRSLSLVHPKGSRNSARPTVDDVRAGLRDVLHHDAIHRLAAQGRLPKSFRSLFNLREMTLRLKASSNTVGTLGFDDIRSFHT